MALRVRRASSIEVRVTTTLMMVFALVAQPVYGLTSSQIVQAQADVPMINEVSTQAQSDWVELFGVANKSVAGWTVLFDDKITTSKKVTLAAGSVLSSEGLISVESTNDGWLGKKGGTVKLLDDKGILQSTVRYGDEFLTGEQGVGGAPDNATATISRTWDGGQNWTIQHETKDTTNGFNPAVVSASTARVMSEEFITNDTSFKGISIGFKTQNFGTATAATVAITRADDSVVTKNANQGVLDIINNNDNGAQLTAPFVIQEGSFTEASDTQYWAPASPAIWSAATTPTSVKITIVDENGEKHATNSVFNQGAPSWPTYESLLPTISNPQPTITGENFNTHSGTDYKGIDVEFSIANFKTVTGVSVDLYDAEDNLLVTNTHNQKLLDLIADDETQLNTSFIITPGSYVEESWSLGSRAWTRMDQPARAVVTVTGTDDADVSVTQTAELAPLVELNDVTFLDVLPVVAFVPVDPELPVEEEAVASDNGTLPLVNPIATSTPLLGNTTLFGNNVFTASNHFVASTPSQEVAAQNAAVLGTQDTAETPLANTAVIAPSSQGWKIFSLAWYWWLLIAIAAMAAWMRMAAGIRRFRGADDL